MIYLLEGNEFKPELNCTGKAIDISADFNLSHIIYEKLKIASESNELVHTQWLRGIGKTYELVSFAKAYGYAVIEPSWSGAKAISEREQYKDIYYSKIKYIRGALSPNDTEIIKDVVVDEGVTNIQELKDAGFNIITGFYTPKKDSDMTFNERVMKTLMDEIEALTPKLEQTRENKDYGTYKNLINAYREVLNLMKCFPNQNDK